MKTNDYVKFMTEQFVSYVDQPRDVRRALRRERKQYKAPVSYQLLGMVPTAFMITVGKAKKTWQKIRKTY